jgi:hypothetical protein
MESQASNARTKHIRFAVLGDVEPKPDAVFTHFQSAIERINIIHAQTPLDFVAAVGDIPHNGTVEQYENASSVIATLRPPLLTIMGNEEMAGGIERFRQYAARWLTTSPDEIELRYTREFGPYTCIFLTSGMNGVELCDSDLDWLEEQAGRASRSTPLLFTHAPAKDIFDINQSRAIQSKRFAEILRRSSIRLHFSGHTHIDPDFTATHVVDPHGVHHIHVPGIERTKVGEKHTPRFRLVDLRPDGFVEVQTFNLMGQRFEEKHRIQCAIH